MKTVKDQEFIEGLTNLVKEAILEEEIPWPFQLQDNIYENSTSGGWLVTLGLFHSLEYKFQIWLDGFSNHESRKLYYGLFSKNSDAIDKIEDLLSPILGKSYLLDFSNLAMNTKIARLDNRLANEGFDVPVLEKYNKHKTYFYGIYEHRPKNTKSKEAKLLISRIVAFISTTNSVLIEPASKKTKTYTGMENWGIVRKYIQKKRDSFIANKRKQQDNYICQICGFNFSNTYGLLGENYAEAHHIIPLGKSDKPRITTVNDLITVCANCHRMLDRMDGTPDDIAKLKKLVNKKK